MADNWFSPVTLTNPGDWCKWTMDVPDTATRDFLNANPVHAYCTIRGAIPDGGNLVAFMATIINDKFGMSQTPAAFQSSFLAESSISGWVSADRFGGLAAGGVGTEYGTISLPLIDFVVPALIPGAAPWVVGANTVRIIHLGKHPDGVDPLAVEIDYIAFQTSSISPPTGGAISPYPAGSDQLNETIPAGFAGHTNPNPIGPQDHDWIFPGDDATTGTAGFATVLPVKFCPGGSTFDATFQLLGGGSPLSGDVIVYDENLAVFTTETLDGDGKITVTGLTTGNSFQVFWGGSDDWGPISFAIQSDGSVRAGCEGWHIGRLAINR